MPALFDALDDAIAAIMEAGRGASGMGAFAASCAIPAGWFRPSADLASLLDPAYPDNPWDRAYEREYGALDDHAGAKPSNPYDPAGLRDATVAIRVGYAYGRAVSGSVARAPGTTETAAYSVLHARKRALEDADLIARAFNCPDIFRRTDTDPQLVDARRAGPSTFDDLGGGRLVCTTPLLVWLQVSNSTAYRPAR